jgi:hypothetical protein
MKTTAYICGISVLVGTLALPIGYYTFLRILVTTGAIWILYNINDNKIDGWDYFLIISAIIFNPIMPIYLNKDLWTIIDIITGGGYLLFGAKFNNQLK